MRKTKLLTLTSRWFFSPFSSSSRGVSGLLSLTLLTSLFSIIQVPPAQAVYGSCGTVLGANAAAQSSIDNSAKINITPRHGSIFYIDTRRGINASYVAYSIKNTDTITKKNLWVKLSNFTAASGNTFVSLANAADNMQQIPSWA